jgi:hypothetical protein
MLNFAERIFIIYLKNTLQRMNLTSILTRTKALSAISANSDKRVAEITDG